MEHARAAASRIHRNISGEDDDTNTAFDSVRSRGAGPGSVASIGSGLAQSARSIAGSFNCAGVNDRSTVLMETELSDDVSGGERRSRSSSAPRSDRHHSSDRSASTGMSSRPSSSSRSSVRRSKSNNRSFREV